MSKLVVLMPPMPISMTLIKLVIASGDQPMNAANALAVAKQFPQLEQIASHLHGGLGLK